MGLSDFIRGLQSTIALKRGGFTISSLPSLTGKTFLVTGGNTGIGYETCLNLAAKGARVYMCARSPTKADDAVAKIKKVHPKADVQVLIMDHMSLSTIVEAAKTFQRKEKTLHGLILNAGIMATPYEISTDGFESQMQTNYLAHWLLTYHLLPTLLTTAKSEGPGSVRIVSVSSEGHQKFSFGVTKILYDTAEIQAFGSFGRYGLSKFANVLHANTLHAAYGPGSRSASQGDGELWAASLHPGFIDTQLNDLNRDRAPWYLAWLHPVLLRFKIIRPVDEGCVSSLFVGASQDFTADMSGLYFDEHATVKEPNLAAKDQGEQEKLEAWAKTEMEKGGWI